jgi:hypothetical protein
MKTEEIINSQKAQKKIFVDFKTWLVGTSFLTTQSETKNDDGTISINFGFEFKPRLWVKILQKLGVM